MWMDQSTPSHEMPQGRGVVCMHQDRTSARGIFVKYTKYSVRRTCHGKWDSSNNPACTPYQILPRTVPICCALTSRLPTMDVQFQPLAMLGNWPTCHLQST
ncbi:hypothetical protein J3E69DRAFT_342134, partial [Trichoderma sp. SZMC 28015]